MISRGWGSLDLMTERLMPVDGAELCVETFGDATDPAVLLVSGAAASMDMWETEFCGLLAAEGRYVIRYDHRDTGRSTTSPVGQPAYSAEDLTTDPVRVLDALGVDRAHLVGLSMGGGIAQEVAAFQPHRLHTLTLIATGAAGERADPTSLPGMEPRVAATFEDPAPQPDRGDRAAAVDYLVEIERPYAGTFGYDEERARRKAERVVDRTRDLAASLTNHWVLTGEAVPFRLADISVPTLVMHGTADPMFPPPHGEALATEIPGASFVPLEGMGHEMPPPPLWDLVITSLVRHTATNT
jgi:pimeloyl-ACP methyl ester carboxylesterase